MRTAPQIHAHCARHVRHRPELAEVLRQVGLRRRLRQAAAEQRQTLREILPAGVTSASCVRRK